MDLHSLIHEITRRTKGCRLLILGSNLICLSQLLRVLFREGDAYHRCSLVSVSCVCRVNHRGGGVVHCIYYVQLLC